MRPLTFGVLISTRPSDDLDPVNSASSAPKGQQRGRRTTLQSHVDLQSGTDLCTALRELGHWAVPISVDGRLIDTLRHHHVDACILALHGTLGGSGDIQQLLAMHGIPFVGPNAKTTRLAFDKHETRQRLLHHNVPTPPYLLLGSGRKTDDRALERLGWPCVVKPRRGALGAGVAPLTELHTVAHAIETAASIDREILLERVIHGREIQVVLRGGQVLGAIEIIHDTDRIEMITPPELSQAQLDGIQNLARRAAYCVGHEDICRVDVLVDERLNEFVLEVEPLPSLARHDVVARVAVAAGLVYEELVAETLDRIVLSPRHEHTLSTSASA